MKKVFKFNIGEEVLVQFRNALPPVKGRIFKRRQTSHFIVYDIKSDGIKNPEIRTGIPQDCIQRKKEKDNERKVI